MAEIDKVRALGFRDQAREKLPIFFGSRDNYFHPLRELIANGTDEINSHFDNGTIKITHEINDNESMITVEDSGRGLPIGETDENGKSYLELLLLTLFAGSKYDNNAGQIGSNGVGLTVTNYTSKYFNVQSAYNGVLHEVTFTDGGNNQDYSTKKISDKKHFTRVSYILDKNVYTGNKFSDTDIENWIKWVSAVAPKIDFEFTNSLGETTNYHYKSLENYFDELVNSQSTSSVFKIEENDGKFVINTTENNQYEVIFTTQAQPVHQVFLNGNPLIEDSSIDSGVINGIRLWFEKYYEGKRKQKPFTNQDIIDSVSYVVNVISSNGEFSNQTKLSTKKALYQSQTKKIVQTILDNFRENHAVYFNRFEKHLMQVQDSNNKNSKSREKLLKKLNENVDGIKGRIDNFIDSRQHGKDSELFLTEGLSALGSVVKARNSDNQAAFPLRGKVLNVEKAGKSAIMDNAEATNILKIIGGGIGKDFNIEKSRFGKIVISCFTGDTNVMMLDGTSRTLKELAESDEKEYDLYSVNDFGEVIPSKGYNARKVGKSDTLYKITLDSGETIQATPDHFFITRQGEYVMAKDLFEGQSLMPLYIDKEYGFMKRPALKDNLTGKYNYIHKTVYDFYNGDYRNPTNNRPVLDKQIHHINNNKFDNRPDNLEFIPTDLHREINASDSWLVNTYNGSQQQRIDIKNNWDSGKYDNVKDNMIEYNKSEKHKKDISKAWKDGKYQKNVEKIKEYNKSEKNKLNTIERNSNPKIVKSIQKNRIIQSVKFLLINNMEINEENWNAFKKIGTPQFENVLKYFDSIDELLLYVKSNTEQISIDGYRAQFEKHIKNRKKYVDLNRDDYDYNHKIAKIEVIEKTEDVYCLTVNKWHNFAISADGTESGVFVKNCDSDDDGFQIQALLITLFNKVAQPLLTNGMVYIAKTPLYIIHFTDKDDVLYVSSENEMADIRPTLKNVKSISRVKGLGELDKETMRDTAMNPETRDIVQVTMEDVEKSVEMIENWFGSSVDYRKEYISEHIVDFLLEEG